tara:strand:- start:260 stop:946 length:687 start_codon:yes stop_codon:yes gene_type:complete
MNTIFSTTGDGYILKSSTVSWDDARDATNGTSLNTATSNYFAGAAATFVSGRTGNTYQIIRSFFYFDTSAIVTPPARAIFKLRGRSTFGTTGDTILVKSSQDSFSVLQTSDFDNVDFNTTYSAELESGDYTISDYNDYELNETARNDMASLDTLKFAVINHTYDYTDTAPSLGVAHRNGMYYANYSGTTRDPKIEYTDIGKINDVTNIAKVNGVPIASIASRNGVEGD